MNTKFGSVDVTLTLSGKTMTLPPFTGLEVTNYGGQPLFCHAQSNGDMLTIVIDDLRDLDDSDSATVLPPAPSGVDVTFAFNGSIVKHWAAAAIPYRGAAALNFSVTVTVDSKLTNLRFVIDDTPPAPAVIA